MTFIKKIGKIVRVYYPSGGDIYEKVDVYRNGRKLKKEEDYSYYNGKIQLTFMPRKETKIDIYWGGK